MAGAVAPSPGVLAMSAVTLAELQFGVLVTKTPAVRAERLRRPRWVAETLVNLSQ